MLRNALLLIFLALLLYYRKCVTCVKFHEISKSIFAENIYVRSGVVDFGLPEVELAHWNDCRRLRCCFPFLIL